MKALAWRVPFVLAVALVLGTTWFAWRANGREPGALAASPGPDGATAVDAAGAETGREDRATNGVAPVAAGAVRTPVVEAEPGVFGRLLQKGVPLREVEVQAQHMYKGAPIDATVRTGADGGFVVPLPQGSYSLALRGAGVPRGHLWRNIGVSTGQCLDLGDLEVPVGATLTGTVVDEHEQPIADALVFVTGNGLPAIDAGVVDVAAVPGAVFTRSDARGRFQLADVRAGECKVHLEHRDYYFGWHDARPVAGTTLDCGALVMVSSNALRGIVFDAHGAPVAGARVVPGGANEHSSLQVRRAVHTDARGLFTLPCFGRDNDLTVFADGCEPLAVNAKTEAPGLVQFVVQPANVLHGRVVGADGVGVLCVSTLPGDFWRGAQWVHDVIYRDHAIAADGTFRVAAVPKGRWQVTATIPGIGTTEPHVVDVPLTAPLELPLQTNVAVAVRVVDDLGAPVPGATVVRASLDEIPAPSKYSGPTTWFGWATSHTATTDANGAVAVQLPAGKPLLLAARSPRHLVAGTTAPAGSVPANVTLVVPRGATIEGRIDDGGLGAHVRFSVQCTATVAAGEEQHLGGATVGRDGRFFVAALPPQSVRVALLALDETGAGEAVARVPQPVPLLGDFDPVVAPIDVDLRAGEASVVSFAAPVLGEITGRVLLGGVPQANAIVYGRGTAERPFSFDSMTRNDEVHEDHPHVRTDLDGRFRFFVADAGRWQLFARGAGSRHWTGPLDVDCPTATARLQVDIVLPAGSIRGSYDVTAVAAKQRERIEAQLYPLADAHHDAFQHGDWTTSQSWRVPKQTLDRDGSFAFASVPPGAWVLRIVQDGWPGTIVWQRVVRIVGNEAHDLGRIEPLARHSIRVRTGAGADIGLWLMEPVDGNEHGLFVWTIGIARDGGFDLGALAPGRYLLRPFRRGTVFAGDWGVHGEPLGQPASIEVHADGRVTPDVVWPDGVK